jgi:hypothetical protein
MLDDSLPTNHRIIAEREGEKFNKITANSILGYSKAKTISPFLSFPPGFPLSGKLPLGSVFCQTDLGKTSGPKKIRSF